MMLSVIPPLRSSLSASLASLVSGRAKSDVECLCKFQTKGHPVNDCVYRSIRPHVDDAAAGSQMLFGEEKDFAARISAVLQRAIQ